ncbi:hypothetical protein JXA63_03950 [Candidatus Woesebacteria bacterium]|nr:hypothetical protein [Candidatus Woesebacteria bacterium]
MEEEQQEKVGKNSSKVLIPIAIIIFAVGVTASVYLSDRKGTDNNSQDLPTPTPEQIQSTPTSKLKPTPTATESASLTPEGWEVYDDPDYYFTLLYPSDLEIRENEDGSVVFVKLGPTQTEGTEVFDGIILTIDSGTYEEDNLMDFVEGEHEKAQQSPVSEISEISESSINGKTAYQYEEVGLGTFTHIYIPFDKNTYVHVTKLVADPTNAGFSEMAEQIISSIDYKN